MNRTTWTTAALGNAISKPESDNDSAARISTDSHPPLEWTNIIQNRSLAPLPFADYVQFDKVDHIFLQAVVLNH